MAALIDVLAKCSHVFYVEKIKIITFLTLYRYTPHIVALQHKIPTTSGLNISHFNYCKGSKYICKALKLK